MVVLVLNSVLFNVYRLIGWLGEFAAMVISSMIGENQIDCIICVTLSGNITSDLNIQWGYDCAAQQPPIDSLMDFRLKRSKTYSSTYSYWNRTIGNRWKQISFVHIMASSAFIPSQLQKYVIWTIKVTVSIIIGTKCIFQFIEHYKITNSIAVHFK